MPSFTSAAETCIHRAPGRDRQEGANRSEVEHLLVALLEDKDVAAQLAAAGARLGALKQEAMLALPASGESLGPDAEVVPSAAFQGMVQRAATGVAAAKRNEVGGSDLLAANPTDP